MGVVKGLAKALLLLSVSLVLSLFVIYATAQTSVTKSYDSATKTVTINSGANRLLEFQLISNTDQCLVDCEAIIRIKPSLTLTLPSSSNDNFKWDFIKAGPDHLGLQSYSFEILETVPYTVNNYREECSPYEILDGNGTAIIMQNCNYVINSTNIYYKQEYRLFKFWGTVFEPDKDYYIKLKGKKYATIHGNNIDWIPTFHGLQINEFAWWNNNWSYTKSLSIKNMNDSVILTEYHPIRVVVDTASLISAGKMKSNCLDARFVYNNVTEMDYNVTNCNSATTVFDFQLRGKNITGNANDTSFNFYYGNSGATYTAKNRTDINGTKVLTSTKALLHFNEMAGSTVFDASSYGNNGTVDSGTAWNASGIFDGSKTYTATTDRMTIADNANVRLEYNTNWTVEFWVWGNDRTSSHFVSKTSSTNMELETGRAGSEGINVQTKGTNGNIVSFNFYGALNSKWHHVAIISNTSADQYQIYLDGRLVNATTNTHTTSIQTSNPWRFGSHDRDPNLAALDTTIDGFRISNDTLTTAQMHVLKPDPLTALGPEQINAVGGANETEGDQAIVNGIIGALGSNAIILTDQKLYVVNTSNGHNEGSFDKITISGNQTWAFNYITTGETFTNVPSLFRTVNIWENQSLSSANITSQVETFINLTKG